MSERALYIINGTTAFGRHQLTRIDRVTETMDATAPPYALVFSREAADRIARLLTADEATPSPVPIEPRTRWQLVRNGTLAP